MPPAEVCPKCHHKNLPQAQDCAQCGAPLEDEGATITGASGWQPAPAGAVVQVIGPSVLQLGTVFNHRYQIEQVLGQGGMGAVYKAHDQELDRPVALKVIRPELASNPEILQRFKQELILARKVTHKNVNRIFDLGEAEGIKFITMEYVEGQDLKSLLRERGGKLAPDEAVGIVLQICQALEAAHSEGVVHRDLKPHNIMVAPSGRLQVMDFGLAYSGDTTAVTQTGTLLGTPEYMSPEQARAEKVDSRSDIFSLGIIFYELLTGETPYKADSAYSMLLKRTQERATPIAKLDPSVPRHISDVVSKCLEIEPRLRYQNVQELARDLEEKRRPAPASMMTQLSLRLPVRFRTVAETGIWWKAAVAAGVLVVAGILAGVILFWGGPAESGPRVSLAILPFQNATGDANLDWLGSGIADMLTTDMGQAEGFRTVAPERLHQILKDLRLSGGSPLDSAMLRRVAEFSSADMVVSGKYFKLGAQIRIDATLQDLKRGGEAALKAEAQNEGELFQAVEQLARSIRENMALPQEAVRGLQATAFRPATRSVEALRYYNEGLNLSRQGQNLDAVKKFEASIAADPDFALAYAELASAYAVLGYGWEAERFSRQAVDLSEKLSEQQRYLIQAHHARIVNDLDKAIEAYQRLIEAMPSNPQLHFELGELYEAKGDFDQALANYTTVLKSDPRHIDALYAAGNVENKRQNFQASLDYLNRALSLAVQLDNQESKARVLQALGYAYQWLNQRDEALRNYEQSLAIKRQIQDQKGMAQSLNSIAQIYQLEGKSEQARTSYEESLRIFREIGDRKGIGTVLMSYSVFLQDRGQYPQALDLAKEALQVQTELGNEHLQAMCQSNIGVLYFLQGRYSDAISYYERALVLREKLGVPIEIAENLYNLAEAYARIGQYEQALTHYLRALEIWRKAGDRLGIGYASYGMGTLFQYQGRYGAALDAMAESLKIFQELQEKSLWHGEVQAGYAHVLALVGRTSEAEENLEKSLRLARELQNAPLIARILNYQGDVFFYQGDSQRAQSLYQEALQTVQGSGDRYIALVSQASLAKVEVERGRGRAVISKLKSLAQEADSLGLKYLATECAIYQAQALLDAKNFSQARRELDSALRASERLGQKALRAQSHFLLAKLQQATGNDAGAARHYAAAAKLLEEMQAEASGSPLLERKDLAAMYADATRSAASPRS